MTEWLIIGPGVVLVGWLSSRAVWLRRLDRQAQQQRQIKRSAAQAIRLVHKRYEAAAAVAIRQAMQATLTHRGAARHRRRGPR
jgi:hypothetical protein